MEHLEKYVGHLVRLNQDVFQRIIALARQQGITPDNRFLVATVNRRLRKLICYGANFCITVSVSEVVLV